MLLLNSKLFTTTILDPLDRKSYEGLRAKAGMLAEDGKSPSEILKKPLFNYIQNQKSDADGYRIMDKKIYPKETKNLDLIVTEIYRKASARHLFEIPKSDIIHQRVDIPREEEYKIEEMRFEKDKTDQLDPKTCLRKLREFQENVSKNILLDQSGLNSISHSWNLQTLCAYTNSILSKVKQLSQKKKWNLGYFSVVKPCQFVYFSITISFRHLKSQSS